MTRLTLNREALKEKELREKRKPLLDAWDITKSNILFGVDVVTDERKAELLAWYRAILDLDETAISSVPPEVEKYVSKG